MTDSAQVRPGNILEVKESVSSPIPHLAPSSPQRPPSPSPHPSSPTNLHPHRIATTIGVLILNSGGVVRGITNWGVFLLTGSTRKHQATHERGHHFIMRFDSSVDGQRGVRNSLALDPRMIRFSVVKLGTTLQEIKNVGGTVDWKSGRGDSTWSR